jgi:maleate isomerase
MEQLFDYELGPALWHRAALGLIVLQSDETIEDDFRRMLPGEGVALYATRIASAQEVSRETLANMEGEMTGAAQLLPRPVRFDAVGYGCTSGTSVIGAARVAELVGAGCDTAAVTEPVSALIAACRALGLRRLAFLSPYVAAVSEGLRGVLAQSGVETPVFGSFNEDIETRVARIDTASLCRAAQALVTGRDVDGLFLSCTNLRTLDAIPQIEAATGLPVLSSNQVLAWHMLRRAGVPDTREGLGRLWSLGT